MKHFIASLLIANVSSMQEPPGLLSTEYVTAGTLEERCREVSPTSASYCFAFVAAVHDAARAYEVWLKMREFCVAPDVSQADLRRNFLEYMENNVEHRDAQAASVLILSFKKAHPCTGPAGTAKQETETAPSR